MKRIHTLGLILILVIAPTFSIGMLMPIIDTGLAVDNNANIPIREAINEDISENNVELNTMFFTETPMSADGLYYVCRQGVDAIAYFGESSVMYITGSTVFTLEFPGSASIVPQGENPTGSVTNYLIGSDSSQWKTGVEDCAVLRYSNLYPGIDLLYKIQDGNLKYDFIVQPYANPKVIQMKYLDASMLSVRDDQITVSNSKSSIRDTGLLAFQEHEGFTKVDCEFQLLDKNTIGFHVGIYETGQRLIIDPLLVYSSFLGGALEDRGKGIVVEDGFIYLTGYTVSPNFPTINAFNSTHGGIGYKDCFVTKLAADGQTLIYSTFLGGSLGDYVDGIAVENGFVYISGFTDSIDFPTFNAYDPTHSGGFEGYVTKLADDGQSLIYSTFLGGTSHEYSCVIAVENGYAYVTGWTQSANFPTTVGAYDTTHDVGQDCYVTKFNTTGNGLEYSTFVGGSSDDYAYGIDVDSGFAYITGYTYSSDYPTLNGYDLTHNSGTDAFVTKIAIDGQSLISSTYIGGSDSDNGQGITCDGDSIYITGYTGSDDFPMVNSFDSQQNGDWDIFVVKLTIDLQDILSSTYLGGSAGDRGFAIAVENGFAYVTGQTESTDFPTIDAYDSTHNGNRDCFVTKIDVDGQSLEYSTYLGGAGFEEGYSIAVESASAYITGYTLSPTFPIVDAYNATKGGSYDCFISIFSDDSDHDSLSDWHEAFYGTNPLSVDSDNDGALDSYEIAEGTDPLDPYSYPGAFSNSEYNIAYSSYLSGSLLDRLKAVRVEDGFIYLSGTTSSSNFPMINAWNSTYGSLTDLFIVKMSEDGQTIIYSTFVGGINEEAFEALDVYDGCVYISGYTSSPNFPTYLAYDSTFSGSNDGFLFKLASDGAHPEFSTYLGGIGLDYLRDMCVEEGYVYVTGDTTSTDFPTVNAYDSSIPTSQQSFVTKFAADGQSLLYSTYLGGTNADYGMAIAVDDSYAYVGGYTLSSDFPMQNPFDDTLDGGLDGYLTKISQNGGSLIYSTYIGGASSDAIQALDAERGFTYLTGWTMSSDFPLSNALFSSKLGGSQSGFVTKVSIDGTSLAYSTYLTGSSIVMPNGITVDKGYVYVTGHTNSIDFPITNGYTSACDSSSIDSFVTKFAQDGQALLYSSCIGGTSSDYSFGIDAYAGRIYIAGYTQSTDYPTIVGYSETSDTSDDGFLTILDIDSDFDALPDFTEDVLGTNPFAVDSDHDNFLDSYEFYYGSNPLDSGDYPVISQDLFDAIYANLEGNASLIQNLITWSDGNASLIDTVMQQLVDNATLLTQVISWLDGNHTAIEILFSALNGNATLLMTTVDALNGNSILIQNLLTWSAGNETLLLNIIDQVNSMEAADLTQVIAWLDGNHTAIETLFTYMEGNATLLLSTISSVNSNAAQLGILAAIISGNTAYLNSLNATHFEDFDEIREVLEGLGITVGDTDYDGLDDLDEVLYGTDILCSDTDCDNLNDAFEIKLGTNPLDDDSDGDSYLDGLEVIAGTDPLDALSYPGAPQGNNPMIIVIATGTIGVVGIVSIIAFKKMRRKS